MDTAWDMWLLAGVRGFEFDVQQDNSTGGKFAYSAALKLANARSALISPDLLKPGLKVGLATLSGCN